MKILWRISIREENYSSIDTAFSGKFGDDLESYEEIYQRFVYIQNMGI